MKRILSVLFAAALTMDVEESAQQLPNLNFDTWSKSGGAWNLMKKDTPEEERVWDTANRGTCIIGINGTKPEYEHVAISGPGKAAVKMESHKAFGKFIAGNLYTGKYLRTVNLKGAEMDFGTPFSARPKSLCGYVHYIPATVTSVQKPFLDLKGSKDVCRIEIVLADWDKPLNYNTTKDPMPDYSSDPHVIGWGYLDLTEDTGGYIPIDIPIVYRSDRTPTYIHITLTSSKNGAFFTGGAGSTLYADEFRLTYHD